MTLRWIAPSSCRRHQAVQSPSFSLPPPDTQPKGWTPNFLICTRRPTFEEAGMPILLLHR